MLHHVKKGGAGMDMGWVNPRVGSIHRSGQVGLGQNFRQIWRVESGRVEIFEMHYVNFFSFMVFLVEISTIAKL